MKMTIFIFLEFLHLSLLGSGPKGVDDLCFHTYGEFSPTPPPPAIRPLGWDLDFEAEIWASRLGSGPQGWDLGLKAGIWFSRLGFWPLG